MITLRIDQYNIGFPTRLVFKHRTPLISGFDKTFIRRSLAKMQNNTPAEVEPPEMGLQHRPIRRLDPITQGYGKQGAGILHHQT
jgi:hypothetical protein